jgi:hypothetical protein
MHDLSYLSYFGMTIFAGTAVEALPLMKNILSQRPIKFGSVEEAIQWQYVASAHPIPCSFPDDQLYSISSGAVRNLESAKISVPSLLIPLPNRPEESQDVVWRTDLMATAPYWEGMCLATGSSMAVVAG